jgi:hypothetical protein
MLFFLVFIITILSATSLALPHGSHLPRSTPADSAKEHEDEHVQALLADCPEKLQPLEAAEELPLDWDIFPHMRPQVEELFESLQMRDFISSLENLFLRVNHEENGNAQFVRSEPIMDIEEDGNFTVTPPERPASAPPLRIG